MIRQKATWFLRAYGSRLVMTHVDVRVSWRVQIKESITTRSGVCSFHPQCKARALTLALAITRIST